MEIVIRGHSRTVPKKLARKAIQFYADILMSSRLHDNIHLLLLFEETDKDDFGYCYPYYDGMNARIFDIGVSKNISQRRTLETIAHEMVHLKQMAKGEWYEYDRHPSRHRWNGNIIEVDKENANAYWLAPWEIEAYGMEYGLFRAFRCHHKELFK